MAKGIPVIHEMTATIVQDPDEMTSKSTAGIQHVKLTESKVTQASQNEARFDEHLFNLVKLALQRTGYKQLCRLSVFCHNGRVILQGRVASYYLKQVAQEATRSVASSRNIDNELIVIGNESADDD